MKSLSGWGNYPKHIPKSQVSLGETTDFSNLFTNEAPWICHGNGRSYGDSALGDHVLHMTDYRYFLGFDPQSGVLEVQAGALLRDIIEVFLPRGWFPVVVPGTQEVTVGGAIASDIHGKNHHLVGCFSQSVKQLTLFVPSQGVVEVYPGEDLWKATFGGMGLTGVILSAKLQLKPVSSSEIESTTFKCAHLKELFIRFEDHAQSPYSVAWIDCLAKGNNLGRSLLMTGDFSSSGSVSNIFSRSISLPFDFPRQTLNRYTVRLFNTLYYQRVRQKEVRQRVSYHEFFFPLDKIHSWNRMYGKSGLTQYQFILPKEGAFDTLKKILTKIAHSGESSFLAVLKLYGPQNENYLSFPLEGYSLALDFRVSPKVFALLKQLDHDVHQGGGRVYLSKDVSLSHQNYLKGYSRAEEFRELLRDYGCSSVFGSLQSKRLEMV